MKKLIPVLILLSVFLNAYPQKNPKDTAGKTDLKVITKNDGTEYIGIILNDDGREVLIETESIGKIYLPKADIKSIVKVESKNRIVNGEYLSTGPFTTRYAFTNNAHPIKKGENYAMINLFGPEIHFAATNNFNIGLMSTWIASPLILAMKYTFKNSDSKINFSAGSLVGTSGYLNQFRGFGGLHWMSMTIGDRLKNFTVSAGYGYIKSGMTMNYPAEGVYYNTYPTNEQIIRPFNKGPLMSLAGVIKVGAKTSLIFDSMVFTFEERTSNGTYQELTPGYYNGSLYVEPTFTFTVKNEVNPKTALLIMPGVRFQKSETKAFQFCLAGVAIFGKNNNSFPFPMCTWFYKL